MTHIVLSQPDKEQLRAWMAWTPTCQHLPVHSKAQSTQAYLLDSKQDLVVWHKAWEYEVQTQSMHPAWQAVHMANGSGPTRSTQLQPIMPSTIHLAAARVQPLDQPIPHARVNRRDRHIDHTPSSIHHRWTTKQGQLKVTQNWLSYGLLHTLMRQQDWSEASVLYLDLGCTSVVRHHTFN